jgi:hypothetical protein
MGPLLKTWMYIHPFGVKDEISALKDLCIRHKKVKSISHRKEK